MGDWGEGVTWWWGRVERGRGGANREKVRHRPLCPRGEAAGGAGVRRASKRRRKTRRIESRSVCVKRYLLRGEARLLRGEEGVALRLPKQLAQVTQSHLIQAH